MSEPQRLATYVRPKLTEARLQSQWARISERPAATGSSLWYWSAGAAVASLAIVAVVFTLRLRAPEHAATQLSVERMASGAQKVSFPEELSITLQSAASYRILERTKQLVHLQLERGAAEFDVTPGRARRVVVTAGGFDVEVVGTHFSIELREASGQPDIEVRVAHGNVKVRSSGDERTIVRALAAGESWATRTNSSSEPATPPVPPATPATPATPEVPATAPSASLPGASARVLTAKDLFEAAEASRLKGNPSEAAAALDRLRRGFPADPRSGLAAFELGRLRMDQLGDPAGAIVALGDAIRLDPSARFREDAQARIVQLYARFGQLERCRIAQTEYLKRYPVGSHVAAIQGLCVSERAR
jgi:TolA-binding protein